MFGLGELVGIGPSCSTKYSSATNFRLPCSLREFVELFWDDANQHIAFLQVAVRESNIDISPWSLSSIAEGGDGASIPMLRTVAVDHPLPIIEWLPWVPSSVRNTCYQSVTQKSAHRIEIVERSVVKALPIVEPVILCTWVVEQTEDAHVDIRVDLSFSDCNVVLLQGLIEYHATAGLKGYFADWEPHANTVIQKKREGTSEISSEGGLLVRHLWPERGCN